MEIKQNIPLKDYTTFKIGGPADYLVEVSSIAEAQEALAWSKDKKIPILVIGGGSNILISDQGFRGLVIKLKLQDIEFSGDKVTVGAGVPLAYLLNKSVEHGLVGLEFCAGIPGTVGGAVRGNAGTYGLAMSDVLTSIKYFDENFVLQEMLAKDAKFSYRHSIFKEISSVILAVDIKLTKGDTAASRQVIEERLKYRQDTQPKEPSAGCIFKNIEFDKLDITALKARGVEVEKFEKNRKIPAAYLIEKAGLKGHTIGGAKISEKHANYIINANQATAEQVIMLISFIKQQIRDKYGVQLIEEVQFVL